MREQFISHVLIISSFSGMCSHCRVQTPSGRDGTQGAQAAAVGRVKPDPLWEHSPDTSPGGCTHAPTGARGTGGYLVLEIAHKKDQGIFKTAHKQPPSSPASGFLNTQQITSSHRETPSALRPKTSKFTPETGLEGVHQGRLRAALSTHYFSFNAKYSFTHT